MLQDTQGVQVLRPFPFPILFEDGHSWLDVQQQLHEGALMAGVQPPGALLDLPHAVQRHANPPWMRLSILRRAVRMFFLAIQDMYSSSADSHFPAQAQVEGIGEGSAVFIVE